MNELRIDDPLLEAYVYETSQIIEKLEQLMISSEKSAAFSEDEVNEIFRLMHTIKGSSAMMMFNDISTVAHRIEDIFSVMREDKKLSYNFTLLVDVMLESIDFFKIELMKIKEGQSPDGDNGDLLEKLSAYSETVSQVKTSYYKAKIYFKKDCGMENMRAYAVIHNMEDLVDVVVYSPNNVMDSAESSEELKKNGFLIACKTKQDGKCLKEYLEDTLLLESLEFNEISSKEYADLAVEYLHQESNEGASTLVKKNTTQQSCGSLKQSIISVNVEKLDSLMDMVGELVISEAMVTQNPEILALELESFEKASRQLHKITRELQDLVMSIRMLPLSTTFMKMHRIVRDMTRKLEKDVELEVFGEETEVDKNVIEKIADPMMHIIRNALDHGIENEEERIKAGKQVRGTITLGAKNSGSDVLIMIRDDGKGLNRRAIYDKAAAGGLANHPYEEMSDKEIYQFILSPGFSTKEEVTEFSGRGVGMDVVCKNIESIGGTVIVESEYGVGTTMILKIPLTLAIIEGMNIKVGDTRFTLPIASIRESFRPKASDIIKNTEGQEMIMVRGLCYPILRLHEFYAIPTEVTTYNDGILIMVEENERSCCIFADELLSQQQVVVKTLPDYVKKYRKITGLGGCTLLGDGSISLILNVAEFELSNVNKKV